MGLHSLELIEERAQLDPPDLGKTEAWVILDAEPESVIYADLKPGCDRTALSRAVDPHPRAGLRRSQ